MNNKKEIKYDPSKGYPIGEKLFYKCEICGECVPSQPEDSMGCKCRNIFIDIDYARISIKEHSKVKLYSK